MGELSYDRDHKLRIIVDASLNPGQVLAQAVHAAIEFTQEHPELTRAWHECSNSVVIIAAPDLQAFKHLLDKQEAVYSKFYEPDLDNRLTAIALPPTADSRRRTSCFPLALKTPHSSAG